MSSLSSGCNVVLNMVARSRSGSLSPDGGADAVDGFEHRRRLGRISRSADGRFVLTGSRSPSPSSSSSSSSRASSDDGGFLSHPSFSNRTWSRRPLIGAADEDVRRRPIVVATVCGPQTPSPYRPVSPGSGKRDGRDRRTVRSVHEQYSQQLPSLRAIHEENQRTLLRTQQQQQQQQAGGARYQPNPTKFRSRHMRYARSAPELTSAVHHQQQYQQQQQQQQHSDERSPESRSSSSGFGSKNTSSAAHQNSAGLDDWIGRTPPYKPPPPPPPALFYANEHWLRYTSPPPSSPHSTASKPLSVDDQYEFDPVFPVSPTPTEAFMTRTPTTPSPSRSRTPTQLKKAKYENVEARLQAMKEEFYAYKRRQAEMARMAYVESAC